MKIGLCEKDLRGTLEENMAWMAANCIKGFQIWKNKLDNEGLNAAEVTSLADKYGLTITSVGGGPNMVDPACAEETIAKFKSFIDLSAELGAPIICAESKSRPDTLSVEDAWTSTTATVKAICEYAESKGAVLAIEAAGPCFIRDHEMFLELKEKVGSPALKVNYDPANIVWADKNVIEGVNAVAADIVHTHAKDIAKVITDANDTEEEKLMDVPAGEGLVDFQTYLPALKASGYDGWLTIEMHAGKDGRPDDIIKARENLEAILKEIQNV